MPLYIAQLMFSGPVRFGTDALELEDSEETLHSDSLFSALCHSWALLHGKGELDALLAEFHESPPFLLSSGFVFSGDSFFLPMPQSSFPGFEAAEGQTGCSYLDSRLGDTRFLCFEDFEAWAGAERVPYERFRENAARYAASFRPSGRTRVAVSRDTVSSSPFLCSAVRFSEGCGLYSILRFRDDGLVAKVEQALRFLGETGVGGERTYGYGRFEPVLRAADPRWEKLFKRRGDLYLTLSLCHPEMPAADYFQGSTYRLLRRRGWCHSPFTNAQPKRKTVTMFAEGSVFQHEMKGHLADVTPSSWDRAALHPVYRYGYALMVPLRSAGPRPIRI